MKKSYIDVVEGKNGITVWTRDMDGVLEKEVLPIQDYLYCFIPSNNEADKEWKDIYGSPLRKISFESKWDMREYTKERPDLCESDISPAYKAIADLFEHAPRDAPLNVFYYDIEVDFDLSEGRGYPLPSNPFGPVNSFQYYSVKSGEYGIIYVCDKDFKAPVDPDGQKVRMIRCKDERHLLTTVASILDEEDVDILTGWNTAGYDLPYLMIRATMCFGEKFAKTMFCRDGHSARSREYVDDFGNDAVKWTLAGRQHLDMMELYKKFFPSEKSSFSLSNVCLEDLGIDKVDYDGDLGELYREDPEHFFEYAFWDAKLLKLLDERHKIIQLSVILARMTFVKPDDVTGAVRPIEHGLMMFARESGVRLPDKSHNEKQKFEGAIVYDTVAGRTGWGMSCDLNQLYPATIMSIGMSPESMVMELAGEYQDYIKVMDGRDDLVTVKMLNRGVVEEEIQVVAKELRSLIRESGYTISAIGIVFDGSFGILPQFVKHTTELRKHYRKLQREADSKGDVEGEALYNMYQGAVKILANSIYGCTGEASFRLFDLRLSRSITMSARIISKFQAWKANSVVEGLKA